MRIGDQNPGQVPKHAATTSRSDRQNNVYVADRNNRRIQVFDADGNFKRFIFLTQPMTSRIIRLVMPRPTRR